MSKRPEEKDENEIEWSSPDTLVNCMKEIKSGSYFVSFGWVDAKLGENAGILEDLCELLPKARKLQALDFESAGLTDAAVEAICESLKRNKSVHTLILNNNKLGPLSAKAIDNLLKLNKSIKFINMREGNPAIPILVQDALDAQMAARRAH